MQNFEKKLFIFLSFFAHLFFVQIFLSHHAEKNQN